MFGGPGLRHAPGDLGEQPVRQTDVPAPAGRDARLRHGSTGNSRRERVAPPTETMFRPGSAGSMNAGRADEVQANAVARGEAVADRPELDVVLARLQRPRRLLARKSS